MAQKFLVPLDMGKLEIQNQRVHNLSGAPSSPVNGQIYYNTTTDNLFFYNGTEWVSVDARELGAGSLPFSVLASPLAAFSFNSQRITNLGTPSSASDAATKDYVDTQVAANSAGLDFKESVRAATTANITLSGTQTVDGINLQVGDRVLVKNQTTQSQNLIYVVASGSWTIAADSANGKLTSQAFVFVEEGTTNGGTQWRVTNTGSITVGSTNITWSQYGTGNTYTAGNGLQLSGNTFSILLDSGSGLSVSGTGLRIDTTVVTRKYSTTIGDGSTTAFTVTHNLGTEDIHVAVRYAGGSKDGVIADWKPASSNTATITFAVAPTTNEFRVTILA